MVERQKTTTNETINLKRNRARLSILLLLIPTTTFVGVLAFVYILLAFVTKL